MRRGELEGYKFSDAGQLFCVGRDLSDMNLTGSLPDAFSALRELSLLELSGNQLTGSLPESYSAVGSGAPELIL